MTKDERILIPVTETQKRMFEFAARQADQSLAAYMRQATTERMTREGLVLPCPADAQPVQAQEGVK